MRATTAPRVQTRDVYDPMLDDDKAVGEPALDYYRAAGEQHGIGREDVIVLGVRDFHQHEEDDEGQAKHAPAAVAEKPDQARQPER